MKTLPNGVQIFNATPHPITFWTDGWDEPISVETDEVVNAIPVETITGETNGVQFVDTEFHADEAGMEIVNRIKNLYPDTLIVGSIIAKNAYAGDVVSMVPHPDYARVPHQEKRMLPNKFNRTNAEEPR